MNPAHGEVYNYALLRFVPYLETDEFVNIGVVAHCASTGRLTSCIDVIGEKRIADFFPRLNLGPFRYGRAAMVAEIQRMEQLQASRSDPALGRALFLELVRPRESLFRFGESRTLLTTQTEGVADTLFERYIEPLG